LLARAGARVGADQVKQPVFVALVALACVLYLVASAGAGGAWLDLGSSALVAVALWSALVPLWVKSDELSQAPVLVRALAVLLALALASAHAAQAYSLLGEVVCALSLPAFSVVALQLALTAPDIPPKLARHGGSIGLLRMIALGASVLGVLAALPPPSLFGRALILPHRVFHAPLVFSLAALALATLLRLVRRRLGSDITALSANVWPALGAGAGLLLFGAASAARLFGLIGMRELHGAIAASALIFLGGHLWLVSTPRARVAHARLRELFSWLFALALSGFSLGLLLRGAEPTRPLLAALFVLGVLTFELLRRMFRVLARVLLAPQRGALLNALDEIKQGIAGAQSHTELGASVLRPLRRASGSPEAAPLLFSLHPPQEIRLDAAGFARIAPRALHEAVRKRLLDLPAAPIVRGDMQQLVPRRPELRELVRALDELSALCVLPLVNDGNLEGALLVAQGARRDPLSLEELDALEGLTRFLAPLLSVMTTVDRMRARLSSQDAEQTGLLEKLHDASEELREARAGLSLLRAMSSPLVSYREPIRYSPPMRELFARLTEVAAQPTPLTLVAEAGCAVLPIAEYVHRMAGLEQAPFVVADCSALEDSEQRRRLFGSGGEANPRLGYLQLAERGTLVLCDAPALSFETQRQLAAALSERRACPVGSAAWYALDARLVVTARRPLEELFERGALSPELARWLTPAVYRVPALRECREDIESLVLIAVDRAGRVLGKNVPGVSPEALSALREHDWPLNQLELESAIERAVFSAGAQRIELADLPPLPRGSAASASFVDQEREILRSALDRAGGNRTRAARALGLKRTTLLEKLRKLGLDDARSGGGTTEH
jgi:DNA-binding NtrC family response regulator